MKTTCYITVIAMLVLGMMSCARKQTNINSFDKVVYTPQYASGFDIRGNDDSESTLISVYNPWQGADSVCTQLFIARGGEEAPQGFDGQVLRGEAKRIVAMSSTHVAMLDAIGEVDRIAGVSGKDFITNSRIHERGDSVLDVGYEGNINYEILMSLEPDLVLLYGVNGASAMEGKLGELGIPYLYIGEYVEESPLGKAEWLVALSEITGKRESGEKVFAGIADRYLKLKDLAATAKSRKPLVMLNTPYRDTWFMPSVRNYAARLIDDAQGEYIYKKNTGNTSMPIDMEEAYLLASEADVWLSPGSARSLDDVKAMCPKFTDTRVFREGNVFNNNARTSATGGNDYYESAVVRPDVVLRDLIKVFHPELVAEDFVYYQQLK